MALEEDRSAAIELIAIRSTFVKIFFKCLVSVGLIAYLLLQSDLDVIRDLLKEIDLIWFVVSLGILGVIFLLRAYKWSVLLKVQSISVPFCKLLSMTYVGAFFNMFLLGSTGGDIVRAYDISKYSKRSIESISTIFIDRITGVLALVLLGLVGAFIDRGMIMASGLFTPLICVFGGLILITFFFTSSRSKFLFEQLGLFLGRWDALRVVSSWPIRVHECSLLFVSAKSSLVAVLCLSTLIQLLIISTYYVGALALNLSLPFSVFLAIIPLVGVIRSLPISINGLGLREVAMVALFGLVLVKPEAALALSIFVFLATSMLSLIGGVLFLVRRS
jgi:uncharacterized protein (TIRG00374 family)